MKKSPGSIENFKFNEPMPRDEAVETIQNLLKMPVSELMEKMPKLFQHKGNVVLSLGRVRQYDTFVVKPLSADQAKKLPWAYEGVLSTGFIRENTEKINTDREVEVKYIKDHANRHIAEVFRQEAGRSDQKPERRPTLDDYDSFLK